MSPSIVNVYRVHVLYPIHIIIIANGVVALQLEVLCGTYQTKLVVSVEWDNG